ncbi:MAG: 30S ribosomal protein S13 [Gemmatimonadetes bacterium]|nr:30S ribosomal protein S13 [Gemmatimonadota bacterium]MCY3714614.1 30S ribosomal protein S13 [Gemmatimonadota bacterium]MDE2727314.1 30S ribosomal protein S13 [Gemmatimonadota bacterium]MXW05034.1 30S ribosomal protein S13 [Gemmatimonadota bacterium]MXX03095.1 30S ribosomal protein S13 [Gemmatimonadota bacterium]
MARIAGIDLPRDKRVEIGITYIFGIGLTTARKVLDATGIDPETRVRDLTDREITKLRQSIENDYQVEGALRGDITFNIRRLMDIGCYRGLRHRRGLPVRGQRTRTNSRIRKGPRRTIGAKRKKT